MAKLQVGALSFTFVLLAGCGNPYAVKVNDVDYRKAAIPADIGISDIKLYERQALINERREEVTYLNKQMVASETLVFAPEIVRDLEVIRVISASLGIRYDAGAAENYQRASEVAEAEQNVRLMRFQAELDQLRRNVELLRDQLPLQTEVSDATVGAPSTPSTTAPTSTVTAAVNQLLTAIAAIDTALRTRLDATTTAPRVTSAVVNPTENLIDRGAHRSTINQMRNQAALDELHDVDGAALLRLSFSASLPPAPKGYNATYSELLLRVVGPTWTPDDQEKAYRQWLDYVNTELVFRDKGVFDALSMQADLFRVAWFYYSDTGAGCHGFRGKDIDAVCQSTRLAAPRHSHFDVTDVDAAAILEREAYSRSVNADAVRALADGIDQLDPNQQCKAIDDFASNRSSPLVEGEGLDDHSASYIASTWAIRSYSDLMLSMEVQAVRGLQGQGIQPRYTSAAAKLPGYGNYDALAEVLFASQCEPWPQRIPRRFVAAVRGDRDQMSVYNLEPREVVQHLSTNARASEALGLAAAISASVPTAGAAADASAGYTRSATGKVDARERVLLALAFANAKDIADNETRTNTFGWRFGPRVVLDAPEQELQLEHHPRSYDLSANVVVPGWWPYIIIEHKGQWSPYASNADDAKGWSRTRLRLSPNVADYNALTARLANASALRYPTADFGGNAEISVCAASDFEIRGVNLWKATAVLVGGRLYEGAALDVSPDMGGIVVTTSRVTEPFPVAPTGGTVPVRILTPLGSVEVAQRLKLNNALPDGRCDTPAEPKKIPEGPTITEVKPGEMSTCTLKPGFTVYGTKLPGAIEVRLGSALGVIARDATDADPTVHVTFTTAQLRTELAGIAKPALLLRYANGLKAEKEVQLVSPPTCPTP